MEHQWVFPGLGVVNLGGFGGKLDSPILPEDEGLGEPIRTLADPWMDGDSREVPNLC